MFVEFPKLMAPTYLRMLHLCTKGVVLISVHTTRLKKCYWENKNSTRCLIASYSYFYSVMWGVDHTSHLWHRPLPSLNATMCKVMGRHLFLNTIPTSSQLEPVGDVVVIGAWVQQPIWVSVLIPTTRSVVKPCPSQVVVHFSHLDPCMLKWHPQPCAMSTSWAWGNLIAQIRCRLSMWHEYLSPI